MNFWILGRKSSNQKSNKESPTAITRRAFGGFVFLNEGQGLLTLSPKEINMIYRCFLNVDEIAAFLRVSAKTIYRLVKEGNAKGQRLPHFKVGRRYMFDRDEVLGALKSGDRLPAFADGREVGHV
ncbi:MAG: helix-turn-helix domain-containing protein [Deltaproteobacteria bacterium]|nr:helix-turn-helix domain-containing protein [Deltaproteobacteria bacterium]